MGTRPSRAWIAWGAGRRGAHQLFEKCVYASAHTARHRRKERHGSGGGLASDMAVAGRTEEEAAGAEVEAAAPVSVRESHVRRSTRAGSSRAMRLMMTCRERGGGEEKEEGCGLEGGGAGDEAGLVGRGRVHLGSWAALREGSQLAKTAADNALHRMTFSTATFSGSTHRLEPDPPHQSQRAEHNEHAAPAPVLNEPGRQEQAA